MPVLDISASVGRNCINNALDVKAVARVLVEIKKLPPGFISDGKLDDALVKGIMSAQRHWMHTPDGAISVGGPTHLFLKGWKPKPISPGVQLPGRLRDAWDLVSPLLPDGSYCSSGYRSADLQRKLLQTFFLSTYQQAIIAKYGQKDYDLVKADLLGNEQKVLEMVRGVGQAIAAPGNSPHQHGKAIDIGGPASIDRKQVDIVKLVGRANAQLFSGKVLMERNGCVHFEIR